MASSLHKLIKLNKSSVSHTTPSEDAVTISSDSYDDQIEADYLGYSPPPVTHNHKSVPTQFIQLVSSGTHDLDFYKSKLLVFHDTFRETYALTISPQSTPLMKNKKPLQQVDILKRIVNETMD